LQRKRERLTDEVKATLLKGITRWIKEKMYSWEPNHWEDKLSRSSGLRGGEIPRETPEERRRCRFQANAEAKKD